MRPASGKQIGTRAVCTGCGAEFVRPHFLQQYCSKRCMTTRGQYGYVTQRGLRGHEKKMIQK